MAQPSTRLRNGAQLPSARSDPLTHLTLRARGERYDPRSFSSTESAICSRCSILDVSDSAERRLADRLGTKTEGLPTIVPVRFKQDPSRTGALQQTVAAIDAPPGAGAVRGGCGFSRCRLLARAWPLSLLHESDRGFLRQHIRGPSRRSLHRQLSPRATRGGRLWGDAIKLAAVDDRIDEFRSRYPSLANPGDRGLLLVLLAHRGDEREIAQGVSDVAACADGTLNVQELAWMIWGATAAARAGDASAERLAHQLIGSLLARYVDPRSGLARHAHSGYRRDVVSFGSTVYFLRALYEYGSSFEHAASLELFDRGVQSMIDIQGPLGEWPWLIDVGSGLPVDPYPIFAVHQDSMAMLFLHPALDRDAPRAAEAISRSVAWVLGENEVATPMIKREPIVAYRSLERRDRVPRVRRYLRAVRGPERTANGRVRPCGSIANAARTTSAGSSMRGRRATSRSVSTSANENEPW